MFSTSGIIFHSCLIHFCNTFTSAVNSRRAARVILAAALITQYKHNTKHYTRQWLISADYRPLRCGAVYYGKNSPTLRDGSTLPLRNIDEIHKTTQRHMQGGVSLYSHRHENPKSRKRIPVVIIVYFHQVNSLSFWHCPHVCSTLSSPPNSQNAHRVSLDCLTL
jgi:hypothetical protein